MDNFDILLRLIAALAFGAILGLETEKRADLREIPAGKNSRARQSEYMRERLGGVRTYTILALFGSIGGILFSQGYQIFAYMIFSAVVLIVLAAYILNVRLQRAFGMTTEIAILITILLGFMVTAKLMSIELLTAITVVMAFILSQKRGIAYLIKKLEHRELQDIIKFAIIVALFLPFLPNHDVRVGDIPLLHDALVQLAGGAFGEVSRLTLFNPLRTWQYVILISGFNLGAYFAMKFARVRGLGVMGLLGGFISSTTTTIALALKSNGKKSEVSTAYAGAALIANGASFLQMLVLAYAASYAFGNAILTFSLTMGFVSLAVGFRYLWSVQTMPSSQIKIDYTPYSIWPAVKFSLLLVAVKFVSQLAYLFVGQAGLMLSLGISGFAGLDVTTITMSEIVEGRHVALYVALWIFAAVNLINFGAKVGYAFFQGDHQFARKILLGLAITATAGIAALAAEFVIFGL